MPAPIKKSKEKKEEVKTKDPVISSLELKKDLERIKGMCENFAAKGDSQINEINLSLDTVNERLGKAETNLNKVMGRLGLYTEGK